MLRGLLGTLLVVMLTAVSSHAATIYVAVNNGGGYEDGTLGAPFNTIQAGIDAATGGIDWNSADVVDVAPGIYMGAVVMKDYVKVVGQDPSRTIIDGANSGFALVQGPEGIKNPHCWIEGFTLQNATGTAVWTLTRNNYFDLSTWEIINCRFINNVEAVYCALGSSANITKTIIVGKEGAYSGGVRVMLSYYPITLTNVTLDNFETQALWVIQNDAKVTLRNSIVTNTQSIFNASRAKIDTLYSLFYGYTSINKSPNESDLTWVQTETIMADPQFTNSNVGDYSLSSASTAIDAGFDVGLVYSGLAPDMGAIEYIEEENITIEGSLEKLAVSYSGVAHEALKGPGEQRREAYLNKIFAIFNHLEAAQKEVGKKRLASLHGIRMKLKNDLLVKCDGGNGGNANNDWITDPDERENFYAQILDLIQLIDNEVVKTTL